MKKVKSKSRYARKQARKVGRGTRDPRWQSWVEVQGKERPIDLGAPPGPISRHNHSPSLRAALLHG
jgi:hypothetical protein